MSLAHSPSIVTNGLAMYYDMANTARSFKGMPTTNLISIPNWNNSMSGWAGWFWVTGTTVMDSVNVLFSGVSVLQGTITGTATGGPAYLDLGGLSTTLGTTYAVSIWFKSSSRGCYAYSHDTLGAGNATGNTIVANGTWQKSTYVFTVVSTTGAMRIHLVASGGAVGDIIYATAPQVEQTAFASPFVIGTRSNTQSLLDLTNNNSLTSTSLTYASDNTFSYNGSNYVNTGYNAALTDFTVGVWFKDTGTPGYGRIIDKLYTTGMMLMRNSTTAHSWGGGVLEPGGPYGIFLTLTDGQWHYLVSVRSGTTHTLYGDGVTNTISNTVSSAALNSNQFFIGTWSDNASPSQSFVGSVPVVQIYNRALTATEVAQNFNALRGRYGV